MQILSDAQRATLLEAARAAVVAHLSGAPMPRHVDAAAPLGIPRGAFVTIRLAGELRGCVGITLPTDPLLESVMRCAVSSATEDPRFPAMSLDQIGDARFEISVLSPPTVLPRASLPRMGSDGLIVTRGRRRGILLPQVAVEQGWSAMQLLEAVCTKAGLAPDAWREADTLIEVFTAEVFSDPP